MFKYQAHHYSEEVSKFLTVIGLPDKTCHSLRHTFNSNLYYLGIDDKRRQYLMGHKSIVMTNDVYTTLDLSVTREDVVKLHGAAYPTFNAIKINPSQTLRHAA